jgi:hypothetical protein
MSAPSASGCWKNGVMKVLSTASSTLRFLQTAATAARSQILSIGLDGLSTQTRRVVGRMAASTAAAPAAGST